MEEQLRIYDVAPGKMEAFIEAWRGEAVPVRRSFGFAVGGAWTAGDRFVWIAQYDGPKDWADVERAYYESDARVNMNPDPGQYVDQADVQMIERVTH